MLRLQAATLLLLWAAFLVLQLLKSKYGHCTWQFAVTFGAQALLLGINTVAFVHYQVILFIPVDSLFHPFHPY